MSSAGRALSLIVAAGFLLRLVLLLLRGDYIVFDEGYYLLLARSLREHGAFQLNGLPHVALSPLQPVIVALVSLAGLPDLWLSRLLGALCASLLAIPVYLLAERIGGSRAATAAALLTAMSPSLMSYLPFFPGRGWNLYFGSEPLFLLLAFTACAAAAKQRYVPAGLACGAAFLTRAEGVVVAPLVMLLLAGEAWRSHQRGAWRGWLLGALCATLLVAPYLLYLRSSLGRWAFSGRVQAAATSSAAPSTRATAQRGGSVLEDFVWGGDQARFRSELYGLTPDGRRMQSQYWGVDPTPPGPPLVTATAPGDSAPPHQPRAERPGFAGMLRRGIGVVVPWWLLVVGLIGYGAARSGGREMRWLLPPATAALLPALVAYVEPRSLLPLAPLAAIGVGLAWSAARDAFVLRRPTNARAPDVALAAAVVLLTLPLLRQVVEARANDTPLQQLASAQRTVGSYLGNHLEPDATVMSWHPAIAIYAKRDWRVMPEAPLDRLLGYAGRHATAVVFSRFHPSPLGNPPRPFTVILLDGDSAEAQAADALTLLEVESTPLIFVGRIPRAAR